jgi:hypothetical protein
MKKTESFFIYIAKFISLIYLICAIISIFAYFNNKDITILLLGMNCFFLALLIDLSLEIHELKKMRLEYENIQK